MVFSFSCLLYLEADIQLLGTSEAKDMDSTSMLLLLLSHISRVRLCVTPQTAAHQAPVPGILQARILEWVAIDIPTPVHKQQIAPSTCNPWNVYNTPGNWPLC